jgi:RNA-directed DNA polymerase
MRLQAGKRLSPRSPILALSASRQRHLLALEADSDPVHRATRSRKGYSRMSQNEMVRYALNNRWLEEPGVPDLRAIWIVLHHEPKARV